jgi:L-threonylcarbamoyladenylate synthase
VNFCGYWRRFEMEVLKLNRDYSGSLRRASGVLKRGELVVYPTDTLYALGGNALNEKAALKVYEAKKRSLSKPLPIAVSDLRMMEKYAHLDRDAKTLADKYLPGALTLILEKKNLPALLTSDLDKVAVRIPANSAALELVRLVGGPVITTSANFTGEPPPVSIAEVPRELGAEIALDQGNLGERVPSTIVDFTGEPRIVREGKIKADEILSAVG